MYCKLISFSWQAGFCYLFQLIPPMAAVGGFNELLSHYLSAPIGIIWVTVEGYLGTSGVSAGSSPLI